MSHRKLRFKGNEYILVGDESISLPNGAIATEEQYVNGETSFAHLFSDGRIMRFREQIGTISDIEWLEGTSEAEPTDEAFIKIIGYYPETI